jgi:hypothetical protein
MVMPASMSPLQGSRSRPPVEAGKLACLVDVERHYASTAATAAAVPL